MGELIGITINKQHYHTYYLKQFFYVWVKIKIKAKDPKGF